MQIPELSQYNLTFRRKERIRPAPRILRHIRSSQICPLDFTKLMPRKTNKKVRVLVVFGTRPEAIKLAPVILEAERRSWAQPIVCVTAQHREMLDQMLGAFGIRPDIDLGIMTPGQSLHSLTAKIVDGLGRVIRDVRPHLVIVQGDTTTTFASALAAFYEKVPVAHVEAGLRTGNKLSPFPEEMNRKLADSLTDFYFAATEENHRNLVREAVSPDKIFVVGNTVVDALHQILRMNRKKKSFPNLPPCAAGVKAIVVTAHRRESFGKPLENICVALNKISRLDENVQLLYPVHLNPNVLRPARALLGDNDRIRLLPPLDYTEFVELLRRSHLILTDSGGIQEEAPALKKPVILMRQVTERPEGVKAGFVTIAGTDVGSIVNATRQLLVDSSLRSRLKSIPNPYGDGHSARRIITTIGKYRSSLLDRRALRETDR